MLLTFSRAITLLSARLFSFAIYYFRFLFHDADAFDAVLTHMRAADAAAYYAIAVRCHAYYCCCVTPRDIAARHFRMRF